MSRPSLPSVAIVGAPNVGKSRLFNRLAGGRRSLVHATPGVTRDRLEARLEMEGHSLLLVDTGGVLFSREAGSLAREVEEQALRAARDADLVLLVVDLKTGVSALERELAERLRRLGRPILLVLNKVDAARRAEANRAEAWDLGLGEGVEVSAEHATGIEELREAIASRLPVAREEEPTPEEVPIAILGRPNAGKSSLFNRLLGSERAIVNATPGTTHDRLEGAFVHRGRRYRLVDTAGLRRGARVHDPLEGLTAAVARGTAQRSAMVLLVVDGERGIDRQDLTVAGLALKTYRPLIVALNKTDLLSASALAALEEKAQHEFGFARYAPRVRVSAATGEGLGALKGSLGRVWEEGGRRVTTGVLNRMLAEFRDTDTTSPRRRTLRLMYATQEGIHPPSFVVFGRGSARVHFAYRRTLENFLRRRLRLSHTPIVLRFRAVSG